MPRPPRLAPCTCIVALLAACKSDPAISTDTEATTGTSGATIDTPTGATTSELNTTGATTEDTTGAELPPLQGVADLHLHMFAEEAFGGGWFHGSHRGPGDEALAPCDGGEPGDHARFRPTSPRCSAPATTSPSPSSASWSRCRRDRRRRRRRYRRRVHQHDPRLDRRHRASTPIASDGWPELGGWPRWDVIAHQQVWEEQLHDAYDGRPAPRGDVGRLARLAVPRPARRRTWRAPNATRWPTSSSSSSRPTRSSPRTTGPRSP
jgi:hypothetical protein